MSSKNGLLLKAKFTQALGSDAFTNLKLVGQERDCGLVAIWSALVEGKNVTHVGLFHEKTPSLEVLFNFDKEVNMVHASLSINTKLLVYTIKTRTDSENEEEQYHYDLFIKFMESSSEKQIIMQSYRQVMAQFLSTKSQQNQREKMLILSHQNSITLYEVTVKELTDEQGFEIELVVEEVIVEEFPWAQWDSYHQILFYIHFRKKCGDQSQQYMMSSSSQEDNLAPTLSALQFNHDTPHESVLNIPVNLPLVMFDSPSYLYNDDPIPLRIHDSSLNVFVVTSQTGIVCICHHYIFQPVIGPFINKSEPEENITVHLAYSVTLLHQARVIHCTVPSVPYSVASQVQPTYALHKNEFMVVSLPGMLIHLIDVDPSHCGPSCHIVLPPETANNHTLAIRRQPDQTLYANADSLETLDFKIYGERIRKAYNSDRSCLLNNLSVLHYFLAHEDNVEAVSDVLSTVGEECLSSSLYKLFNELLVGGTYSWVSKILQHPGGGCDDKLATLAGLLPITTLHNSATSTFTIKRDEWVLRVVQEELWNPGVMLLTRQQRLCPYRNDLWTRLLDLIPSNKHHPRFRPSTVADKLMVSLVCYQPEALSKCTTPLSPGIGLLSNFGLFDMNKLGRIKSQLPFFEIEKCTASKQEHIISVNLRELSMHLVKYSNESGLNINTIATRYTASQLEMSKYLCALATRSAGVRIHLTKGFQLIDTLGEGKRRILFHQLERVMVSADSLAFPLPPGFHSFSSYLGYRVLPFHIFIQYVEANVLQLQIDVIKVIIKEMGDTPEGTQKKLQLLSLVAKSRAKRLLDHCSEPISLILRAREHSANILSGMENQCTARRALKIKSCGLNTFCSSDRLSPLETFLNLLTAKASLPELDFNLLAEATTASISL